jgi:hypothetical protein
VQHVGDLSAPIGLPLVALVALATRNSIKNPNPSYQALAARVEERQPHCGTPTHFCQSLLSLRPEKACKLHFANPLAAGKQKGGDFARPKAEPL